MYWVGERKYATRARNFWGQHANHFTTESNVVEIEEIEEERERNSLEIKGMEEEED